MIPHHISSRASAYFRQWQRFQQRQHRQHLGGGGGIGRRHPFHASSVLRGDDVEGGAQDHYETLKVSPDASPAEIKKSFYHLSKTHHPDHNPGDPHAPRRFMRVSEAWAVLSVPAKRAAYDRDVLRYHHHGHGHGHSYGHGQHHRSGSYHSTGPAGGRPASGLSRRRGTFTGPPPSFYRSGGWGAHGAKQAEAASGGAASGGTGGTTGGMGGMGGMGPGQNPFGHEMRDEDIPHFDREAHERTQRRGDERRARRMAGLDGDGDRAPIQPQGGILGSFLGVCGILALSVIVPYTIFGGWPSRPPAAAAAAAAAAPEKTKPKPKPKSRKA